ncbi:MULTISPECIES: hypothetical protein [Clostridium]|nr:MULTISPECIES: hypothetical protein [Clostridium]MDB2099285.1 hypothetical protein [Clostridium paraputrificum]MDB2107299.1 hypothetical protein [Clostridium paraputrificum]MDB2113856.1 hypothetical protein [Clostridium paraputrificum]MDB2118439.1 hypothetical protein [Clostridium paraputrificum]MDU2755969.1 hypothetical protein [Clostridium sp.]
MKTTFAEDVSYDLRKERHITNINPIVPVIYPHSIASLSVFF